MHRVKADWLAVRSIVTHSASSFSNWQSFGFYTPVKLFKVLQCKSCSYCWIQTSKNSSEMLLKRLLADMLTLRVRKYEYVILCEWQHAMSCHAHRYINQPLRTQTRMTLRLKHLHQPCLSVDLHVWKYLRRVMNVPMWPRPECVKCTHLNLLTLMHVCVCVSVWTAGG